jgi:DNA-binding response OmpR family regulator
MPNLLFIDDDLAFSPLVKEFLETQGMKVDWHPHSDAGLTAFFEGDYDLCLLDIKMPFKDGFTVAEEIRSKDAHTPIIFLTGQHDKADKLHGFEVGADDYITKPFSLEELMARIRAVLRRFQFHAQEEEKEINDFTLGEYTFDHNTRELHHKTETMTLSAKEAALLHLLFRHKNRLLPRNVALKEVWGEDNYFKGMSMNVYVSKLRKYLKHDDSIQILNVHGEGYKLMC